MEDKKKKRPILPEVTVYMTEKDVDKRINWMFVRMLEGISKMLVVLGATECKGGGCIDPREALFHCKACTMNGIQRHVDQAIEYWRGKV